MSKMLQRAAALGCLFLSVTVPLRADTLYLFTGDRSPDASKPNSIHRYRIDPQAGVLLPAPSAGQTGDFWGSSVGKPYHGTRFTDIAIAPNGDLYAVGRATNNVIRFNGQTGADKGEVIGGLQAPDGITVGPDGNLYIASDYKIVRCKPDGTPLPGAGHIGNIFAIGGGLSAASGLAFGPDGNLYVVNQVNGQVARYNGVTGAFMDIFTSGLFIPSGLAFGPDGHLYVANTGGPAFNVDSGYVVKIDGVTGKFISKFAPDAKGVLDLEFLPGGDLLVSDHWNGQIKRYNSKTGEFLGLAASSPPGSVFYYMTLARQDDATARLKSVNVTFPTRATSMKSNLPAQGAETVKGWKNALIPKGTPGPLLTLASNKKTSYSIVLPANPATSDQKAAAILALYLEQITGAKFTIAREGGAAKIEGKVISIGRTTRLKTSGLKEISLNLGEEGYAVAAKGDTLFLFGGKTRGATYAVQSLLEEDLGCRWYGIGGATRIPRKSELSFKPSLRHFVPTLEIRDPFYLDAFDTDWSFHNKTSSPDAPIPEEWGGHAKTPSGYMVHTYERLVPATTYFKEHPEYFAEIEGKRRPTQLDLSNPDVLRITVENLKQVLRNTPGTKIISVSPNDGRGYCACSICSAIDKAEATTEGSRTGSLLKFVNEVAEAIEPEFPTVRISTLAYLDTFTPPKTIRPRKNVAIQLCTDSHAWKYQFCFTTESQQFQNALKAWDAIGADIYIWDYTTDYVHTMVPMPNMPVVTDNMRFYMEHGAKGIMLEGNSVSLGNDMGPMRSWVWAKQMWDPSLDTRKLMRDFIYGYYGTAAEPIWNYNMMIWQMWEEHHKKPHVLDSKRPTPNPLLINDSPCSAPPDWSLMSPEFLEKSTKLFVQSEALAKDPETLKRVRVAKLSPMYVKLAQGLGYITEFRDFQHGTWVKTPDENQRREYQAMLDEFISVSKANRVRTISGYTETEQLTNKWQEILSQNWADIPFIPVVKLSSQWKFKTDPAEVGVAEAWFAPQTTDAVWDDVASDRSQGWEGQGFPDYRGTAWYRQKLVLPTDTAKSKHQYLYFSAVDSECEIYINGVKVFDHTLASTGLTVGTIWDAPFTFDAAPWLKAGQENVIAVRVTSSGGVRGIWRPAYLIPSDIELSIKQMSNAIAFI